MNEAWDATNSYYIIIFNSKQLTFTMVEWNNLRLNWKLYIAYSTVMAGLLYNKENKNPNQRSSLNIEHYLVISEILSL